MLKLTGFRLLALVPLLLLVTLLSVGLIQLIPGDAAETIAGASATPEQIDAIRAQLNLDSPVLVQYWDWVTQAATGDFGQSLIDRSEVLPVVLQRFSVTIAVSIVGAMIGVLLGVSAGTVAALRPGGLIDRLVMLLASAGLAVPAFWLAMILVSLFALRLGWFPATGYTPPSAGLGSWLASLILPGVALGVVVAAMLARHARASMIETLQQPYIRTARAMGIPFRRVVGRYALKSSLGPVTSTLGFHFAHLLGGAVVVEAVFGIHGLGTLALDATTARDIPVIQAVVVVTGLCVAIAQLLVDLSYGLLNPKVRPS